MTTCEAVDSIHSKVTCSKNQALHISQNFLARSRYKSRACFRAIISNGFVSLAAQLNVLIRRLLEPAGDHGHTVLVAIACKVGDFSCVSIISIAYLIVNRIRYVLQWALWQALSKKQTFGNQIQSPRSSCSHTVKTTFIFRFRSLTKWTNA